MSPTLDERLGSAAGTLEAVSEALNSGATKLKNESKQEFQQISATWPADIKYSGRLIKTRASARSYLTNLEKKVTEQDRVQFGDIGVEFECARLLGTQAYLTTNWALADKITGMAGRLLCTPKTGCNRRNPASLVSNFVTRSNMRKGSAAVVFNAVREHFGWPIGVSYAIRNLFVHDGAKFNEGIEFFEGTDSLSAFTISDDGWTTIIEYVEDNYGLDSNMKTSDCAWPGSPKEDLRILLDACEREVDCALGVILETAMATMRAHIGVLLEGAE